MPRNVWNDIVSLQTGRLSNSTKYLLHASMTTTSKKKKWNLLENCHKYALTLFWNAYTWHVLEDLTSYGQWTNLHDRSRNGPKPVTNAWIDWFHAFITHVNTNSIATWVVLQNNADWDCFKTPILREILRIQNPLLEELCAFLEVIHLFQQVGWVRNKLQFHTVQQNPKAGLKLDGIPALNLWDLIVSVLGNTTQNHDRKGRPVVCPHTIHKRKQSRRVINDLGSVDFNLPNAQSSHQEALLYVF